MNNIYFLGFIPKPYVWVVVDADEHWYDFNDKNNKSLLIRDVVFAAEGKDLSIKVTRPGMVWISSNTKRLTISQEDDYFKAVELRKKLIKIANVYNYLLALTSKEYISGFSTSIIPIEITLHETMCMKFFGEIGQNLNEPTTFIPTYPNVTSVMNLEFKELGSRDGQISVDAYKKAFDVLERLDEQGIECLNTLSKSESEYLNSDYSTSLILSWFIIEHIILDIFLREANGNMNKNGNSPKFDDMLSKVQSTANYREYSSVIALITQAKNARNGFAHRNEQVDKDSAEKSLNAAFALASYKLKIDLKHSIYVPQILSYAN
ncbi:hypothetical protein [Shewanella xiamenensis]|uniref:hypothetical protein n=1 Tax=Shewanella xiamenensis TaxID=332186 RepID=UPI0004D6F13C|nr:hypothetical protein [Shewanella xiamenensis]KEK29844.1 NosL family protein [Shewanella xiamenensis]